MEGECKTIFDAPGHHTSKQSVRTYALLKSLL